jgi:hypothetical protein
MLSLLLWLGNDPLLSSVITSIFKIMEKTFALPCCAGGAEAPFGYFSKMCKTSRTRNLMGKLYAAHAVRWVLIIDNFVMSVFLCLIASLHSI